MPLRVWQCPQCGHEEEFLERKQGERPEKCSVCGNKKLILVPAKFNLVMR
jgi:rRNA maturation protein Nop10